MIFRCITFILSLVSFASIAQQLKTENLEGSKLSYGFIENKGQVRDQNRRANSSVKYLLSLPGTNVALRSMGFSYDTYIIEGKEKMKEGNAGQRQARASEKEKEKEVTYKYHRVDVEFVGANSSAIANATEKSSDFISYYSDQDQGQKVYHYGKVTFKNIYPGIDVEFVARPGKNKPVEYNFIVNPGADISQIQLAYKGANKSELVDGKVELSLAHGKLEESIPASYYLKDRRAASVKYKRLSGRSDEITVGFEGDVSKPTETLVIDPTPTLHWGINYGGQNTRADAVTTDGSGNVYVAGHTTSTTNIATVGSHQTTLSGQTDAFIAKFNSSGTLQWGTYYGGSNADFATAIVSDGSSFIYVVGDTQSTSGIATAGAPQTTLAGSRDGFLVKLNFSGVRQWGTYFGGNSVDFGHSLAIDVSGNLYVAGSTFSTSSIATAGTHQLALAGQSDAFIFKLNSSAVKQWGTYYGGTSTEQLTALTIDPSGNIAITGTTFSSTGIATAGAYQTSPGFGFIAKFTNSGVRSWGTYISNPEVSLEVNQGSIDTDDLGNIYAVGQEPPGARVSLIKLSTAGAHQWTKLFGNGSPNGGIGRCVEVRGDNVFVTGYTFSPFFEVTGCASQTTFGGVSDAFIIKALRSDGTVLWAGYYGGADGEEGKGLAIDPSENIYVVGSKYYNGGTPYEGFIARFSQGNSTQVDPNITPNATTVYLGQPVIFTAASHVAGNNYKFTYLDGTPQTVNSTQAQTNITLQHVALYTITLEMTNGGCIFTTTFDIEVQLPIALCATTLPLTGTGTLKLDKFSGQVLFTLTSSCADDFLVGCIGGKVDAPLLNNVVAASAIAYSDKWDASYLKTPQAANLNAYERNERGKWRPASNHTFNKGINYQALDKNYEAGRFQLSAFTFQNPTANDRTGWLRASKIDKYTPDGDAVEEHNALNIASSAKVGYHGTVPYLIAQNAEYGSVYFEGFENVYTGDKLEEDVDLEGGGLDDEFYHSGKSSLSLTDEFSSVRLTVNDQLRQKGLQLRFWAKGDISQFAVEVDAETYTDGDPAAVQPTVSPIQLIARSGEWALVEAKISNISAASDEIVASIVKAEGGATWIDDVRLQPMNAEVTCYVYDSRTLQLLAVFDDQHFGMFYQYNAEGKLIRKMIETDRGVKTIQEKQYNLPTIDKITPVGNN